MGSLHSHTTQAQPLPRIEIIPQYTRHNQHRRGSAQPMVTQKCSLRTRMPLSFLLAMGQYNQPRNVEGDVQMHLGSTVDETGETMPIEPRCIAHRISIFLPLLDRCADECDNNFYLPPPSRPPRPGSHVQVPKGLDSGQTTGIGIHLEGRSTSTERPADCPNDLSEPAYANLAFYARRHVRTVTFDALTHSLM